LRVVSVLSRSSSHRDPHKAATSCPICQIWKIAAGEIGFARPAAGTIASTQIQTVPTDSAAPGATSEFCKVLGAILPVDPNAPPVNFEVTCRPSGHGKAVQYGGGGTNGT